MEFNVLKSIGMEVLEWLASLIMAFLTFTTASNMKELNEAIFPPLYKADIYAISNQQL